MAYVSVKTSVQKKGSFAKRVALIKKIAKQTKKQLYVGLVEGKSPAHVIEYGLYNEFGTVHIPERPFIRSSVQKIKRPVKKIGKKAVKAFVNGKGDLNKSLDDMGKAARDIIRAKILSGISPELDPQTIARKGHDLSLVDTGALFDAITYEIK